MAATLYSVTENIKILLKWAAIIAGAILILFLLIKFIVFLKNIIAPTPPPPPTVAFGKLPQLYFPPSTIEDADFTYSINTLSGELNPLSDRMAVYQLATPSPTLLSLQKTQDLLQQIGFKGDGVRVGPTLYQWTDATPPSRKMQYDIVSKNFTLTSAYITDQEILAASHLPDENSAIKTSENFLDNLEAFADDIDATKSATHFFAIQNNTLVPTTSLSNAQIIRVDFFQKDIQNYPIYYPLPKQSIMYTLIGSGNFLEGTIVETGYIHHTITDVSATYPIYTVKEAYALLQKGKAYIASHTGDNKKVLISNVTLGYYLGPDTRIFLMPIIVFEGNNDFRAYLPAVKEAWIEK